MKAFKFSLEQLLKYRKDMAESARLSLAGKVGSINALHGDIANSIAMNKENFIESRKNFDAQNLRQAEYFSAFQTQKQNEATQKIRRLNVERAELESLYQERYKKELVLTHLRDRAYQKHKKKQQHIQQIRLDDMINSLVHADKQEDKQNLGEKDGRIW
jgi:hypothetical protein